jgi:rod shape-determining protein MreC
MQYLIAFLKRHTFFFLFLLLEVIAFMWFLQSHVYQRMYIQQASNQVVGHFFKTVDNVSEYFALADINQSLIEENARLKKQLSNAWLKKERPEMAKETLSFVTGDSVYQLFYVQEPVHVIHNSVHKANNYIMLDKGSEDGITKDMGLVGRQGVVGIVVNTSQHFSWAMSMLHSNMKLSAMHKNSGHLGTVEWEGVDYHVGVLKDIPAHVKIAEGDSIVTSGFSQIFPRNLLIGTVSGKQVNTGDNRYVITVDFAEDFNKLYYGYVVKNLFIDEINQLKENQKPEE